ncbi:MAG: response regulator [Polyangiaceae bacterium]
MVKSLGELLTGHPLFAGVTIRGNGELALILDVPALLESAAPKLQQPAADSPEQLPSPEKPRKLLPAPGTPDITFKPEARARSLRVLFVDDSLSVRKVAEKVLTDLGAEVVLAVDGFDALGKLREGRFDIVFTDLEMPKMHGYDLIRELRFLPTHAKLPIVVVSSRSGQKHQAQAQALGASDYLTKPFSPQSLKAALDRWCSAERKALPEPRREVP